MEIITSPDIIDLKIKVTWDIAGTSPVITLVNESTGSNLGGIDWAFTAISPSGTYIAEGSIDDPDIEGSWSTYTITNAWPKPFNQIEWSGLPYQFYCTIRDSEGNEYTSTPQTASICRPVGNTQKSTNPYGIAKSNVSVQCQQGRVFFQDATYHSYKGEEGTLISSALKVLYPIDETGNIPDAFSIGSYSSALVPISYSSPNYQFLQTCVYEYEIGDNTFVRIKYQLLKTFAVWCNIDLMALQCEISKLSDEIESGNCVDVQEAQRKMNLIMPKFCLVVMGTLQPLLGIDVPVLIEEIEKIGGFNCNCCAVPTGIIPVTASIIDGYSFSVNKLGGDVNGYFTNDGSNITLNIGDVSYVVTMGISSPSTFSLSAINFTNAVSGDGFTKTYYLNIDGDIFISEILDKIGNNPAAINQLNELINTNDGNWQLIVDGDCIFQSTSACNYAFGLSSIPATTTFALLTSIKVGANTIPLNYSFNQTNLSGLQGYLNGLGYGTFVVTNLGSGNVSITSTANPNQLLDLTYKVSSTNNIADFSKECTGFIPKSANEVVQAMIYYMCGLDDTQLVTSQDYVITFVNPTTNLIEQQTVASGATLNEFIIELLDGLVETTNYIIGISKLNCANVINIFPSSIQLIQNNDILLGTKNGVCAQINPIELGTRILQLGQYDAQFMEAFCAVVNLCANGQTCSSPSVYSLSAVYHSPSDNLMDIVVTYEYTDSFVAGIKLRYARVDNTNNPVYTTISFITLGSSPYTIEDIDEGEYIVEIAPVYSDGRNCAYVSAYTPVCVQVSAFSAVNGYEDETIDITYTTSASKVKLTVSYPNGGSFSQIYSNTGTIEWTVPSGVYGVYSLTLSAVCNEDTEWISVPTAPVLVNIPNPAQSSIINNSATNLTAVFLSAATINSGVNYNFGTIAGSGGAQPFFFDDNFYTTITISWNTGTVASATLVTGSGSYPATVGTNTLTFSNVTTQNGITITIED